MSSKKDYSEFDKKLRNLTEWENFRRYGYAVPYNNQYNHSTVRCGIGLVDDNGLTKGFIITPIDPIYGEFSFVPMDEWAEQSLHHKKL